VANLWLARVGATNQLAQSAANAAAAGGAAQGQIWGSTLANVAPYAGGAASGALDWAKGLVTKKSSGGSAGDYMDAGLI
jgi:hypothetical protein